jgi:polygalacturonase
VSLTVSLCSAGISIGSEMSGGVANVTVENVHIWDSRRGVKIKTAKDEEASFVIFPTAT